MKGASRGLGWLRQKIAAGWLRRWSAPRCDHLEKIKSKSKTKAKAGARRGFALELGQ